MADYTTLADLDVPAIADRYGLRNVSADELKGGAANSSFRLHTADGQYVLTVLDNHDADSAARLAALSRALYAAGMPTVQVVADRDDNCAPCVDGRPLLLKRFIPGQVREPLPAHLLGQAGALLAALHNLPTDLPGLATGTLRLSDQHVGAISGFEDQEFAGWLTRRLEAANTQAASERPAVVCHGDLFADNLIIRPDDTLSVIDWETASLDDPLLDLGMAVVGLAQENQVLVPSRMEQLVEGYASVRSLSDADHAELPSQIGLAAAIIAFHRYYRHNVRYPDPAKAHIHRHLIDFNASVDALV
jgi:homoserine kinase type II